MTRTRRFPSPTRPALALAAAASTGVVVAGLAGAGTAALILFGGAAAVAIALVGVIDSRPPLRAPLAPRPEMFGPVVISAPKAGAQAARDAA